jgi:uncharacterized protein (TIGR03067 family)
MPEILDGIWLPVDAEFSGQRLPEGSLDKLELALSDGKYALKVSGTTIDQGVIELFPESTPKAMKITGSDGPNKGRMIPAIYELDAKTLTICYDLSGAATPAGFRTEGGTQLYRVTYNRQSD